MGDAEVVVVLPFSLFPSECVSVCMCIVHICTVYWQFTFLLLSFPFTLIIIMKDTNTQLLKLKSQTSAICRIAVKRTASLCCWGPGLVTVVKKDLLCLLKQVVI